LTGPIDVKLIGPFFGRGLRGGRFNEEEQTYGHAQQEACAFPSIEDHD
jgi:hypothetical protein